jgi:hypothetical protein
MKMSTQYHCENERRRQAVLDLATANGIDYLEVSEDQRTLTLYFLHNLPGQTDAVPPSAPALTKDDGLIARLNAKNAQPLSSK